MCTSADNHRNLELIEQWADSFIRCSKINSSGTQLTLKSMLKNILGKAIWVTLQVNDQAIGFGFGVIDQGYVGIFDILVDESFRGKGHGKAVMNKLLIEAKKLGANKAYLQVVVGNLVAENLYQNMGFKEMYRKISKKSSIYLGYFLTSYVKAYVL